MAAMSATHQRVQLEGISRVGFGVEPGQDAQGIPFPSCLSACLEFMGEGLGYQMIQWGGVPWRQNLTYVFLGGVSGAFFRLSWKPGWHPDNVAVGHMSDDPIAPFRRAFEAIGRGYELVRREPDGDNEAVFRQRIAESIRERGRPVLGFGVVGPPECCIITGYDECGDVLIGWSYFQGFPEFSAGVEFEPSGHFRKRGWFADTESLLLIGDRVQPPMPSEIHRGALEWALRVARTPVVLRDRHNGLAAYTAWGEHLLRDDDFPAGDQAVLYGRYMVHNDAVSSVAEGRWYAAHFLRNIADKEPAMAGELLMAAAHYQAEHDLMWRVWDLTGGLNHPEAHLRLAESAIRRRIVPLVLEARDEDAGAALHIERALA